MTAYLDASVILRVILGQTGRLKEWRSVRRGIASALGQLECLRTLDRLRLREGMSHEAFASRRAAVLGLFEEFDVVEPTLTVLARASLPLPVPVGTLDAIHLATALLWREREGVDLVMATHDAALAAAARACDIRVVGA